MTVRGGPSAIFPAEIQHHHLVGDAKQLAQTVFDHDDGFSIDPKLLDDRKNGGHFRHAEAGKEFIEDDEIRTHGQALTQFEAFQIAVGQHFGDFADHVRIPLESDFLEDVLGNGVPIPVFAAGQAFYPRGVERHDEIFESGQLIIGPYHLERANDAGMRPLAGRHSSDIPPLEQDPARIRFHEARDQIHQRGLAGSIGTDDPRSWFSLRSKLTESMAVTPPNLLVSPETER